MGLDQNYLHSILGRNLQKFQVIPIHPWFVHPISRTAPPGRSGLQEHGAKLQREELESRARESRLTSRVVWRVGRPLYLMGLGARAENKDSIWLSELAALYRGSSRFRFPKATAKLFRNLLRLMECCCLVYHYRLDMGGYTTELPNPNSINGGHGGLS